MKYIFTLLFIFSTFVVQAQKEASYWYFGNSAGLKFNDNGTVTDLADGQAIMQGGCATISDKNGNLLFYTNGGTIWNKNHQIMANGNDIIGGLYFQTQSSIILPKPNSNNLYYLFVVNDYGYGHSYSVIDMNGDNGLGEVTSEKNILLYTPFSQKLTAVKHANNKDYWIVTQTTKEGIVYCYLLTENGVNPIPIQNTIGQYQYDINRDGGMKLSPDGKKLVAGRGNQLVLYDFDSNTGIISNEEIIFSRNFYNSASFDSVEFSADSKVVYGLIGSVLVQVDLKKTSNSYNVYDFILADYPKSIQLGIDNKIYISDGSIYDLSVINSPSVIGSGCNYQNDVVALDKGNCILGLPNFCVSYFNSSIQFQNSCVNEAVVFSYNNNSTISSILWNFGDGTTSTSLSPSHTYTSAGTYTITASVTTADGTSTETKDIVISTVPKASPPQDLVVCDTDNDGLATFDLTTQNAAILNGQDPTKYSVTYYANAADFAAQITITNPKTYSNPTAYKSETLVAEVANLENNLCKASCSFQISVFESPKPKANTAILPIQKCDDNSFGTDTDGKVVFDLTQRATAILNGQSASQFVLSYFKDAAFTQSISNPAAYVNTNTFELIYIKMANKDHLDCMATTYFAIQVMGLPIITSPVSLKQCDDDTDGFSRFNLEEAQGKISSNSGALFSYFKTQTDAQNNTNPIANPKAYTNSSVTIDKVYVRVATDFGCFRIAELNLIVSTTQIPATFSQTLTQCDDVASGSNTDGVARFDFSSVTTSIENQFPTGQQLDIRYFKNLNDALAEQNAIPNPANYSNTDSPHSQNIYVRVDSKLDNSCLGLGQHIRLVVERIPIIASQKIIRCDDNQDGQFAFDTSTIQSSLLNGMTNVRLTYFDKNNLALASPLPNPLITASQTLKAIATNTTPLGCSFETSIEYVVDDLPEAFPIAASATKVCDDEVNPSQQDGKFAFPTTGFQETILGGQTGMQVRYFDQNNVALPSPLPNPFVTGSQKVKAEVINPKNTNCTATVTIPFEVHAVPMVDLTGDGLVCSNLSTFTKVLEAGILDGSSALSYSYQWTFNNQPVLGANAEKLSVNTAGTYTVTTTNDKGCSRTRTITVTASDVAKITEIKISDLNEENTITVSVTGSGNYVFGLDEVEGPFQKEAFFDNVKAGIHTIYVKDLNGCGLSSKEVAVLGIPTFFTPNGDGIHDFWNIKGVNSNLNAKTNISIFDRYGKLLKQLNPNSEGWDGNFTDQQLPADDYWYSIQLEDGRVFKGHFALKR